LFITTSFAAGSIRGRTSYSYCRARTEVSCTVLSVSAPDAGLGKSSAATQTASRITRRKICKAGLVLTPLRPASDRRRAQSPRPADDGERLRRNLWLPDPGSRRSCRGLEHDRARHALQGPECRGSAARVPARPGAPNR